MPSGLPDADRLVARDCTVLFRLTGLLMVAGMLLPATATAQAGAYPETTAAIQERYADEVRAHAQYGAYAKHALQDGHANIAHLFRALATSEAVHARNFAAVLEELGVQPQAPDLDLRLSTTREHLQQATTVEANEIDENYPAVLARIRPEGNQEAIDKTTWAWESEKQHRELIIKIRDAAGTWFGLLVRRIEGEPSHYHVCQICGSTLDEPPVSACPICGHPAAHYREVPWQPAGEPKENGATWDTDG